MNAMPPRKCSFRFLFVRGWTDRWVITQDSRRRHRPVTGNFRVYDNSDTDQEVAKHYGCVYIVRTRPRSMWYDTATAG